MNELNQRIEQLSEKQRLLLARWIQGASAKPATHNATRKRLFAYVTPAAGSQPDVSILRNFLSDRLPDYMVPETITILHELPRLPNGKVSRRQLPDPQRRVDEGVPSGAPTNEIEQILLEIWADLLHAEMLGVHDNFFEFGGDSIVSIQVVSRAREAGLDIEPRQLAENPTIADLAAVVTKKAPKQLQTGPTSGTASPLPIQSWFLERNLANPSHWNQTRLYSVDPRVTADILQTAIQVCTRHHHALRSRFLLQDGQWQQSIAPADDFEISMERVTLSGDEHGVQITELLASRQAEFAIDVGPLVRFVRFQLAKETAQLAIVAHHLVIDHVSWMVLAEDLNVVCRQLLDGLPADLPAKTTMIEWSQRLAEFARSEEAIRSLEYWQQAVPEDIVALPRDLEEQGDITEASVETLTLRLDEQTTKALTLSNETYNTNTQDILLTALAQALTQWTGRDAIRVDLEGHGREVLFDDVDVSRTVGWFTSFFPTTLDLSQATSLGTAIKVIKEQRVDIPHRGLSYPALRYFSADVSTSKNLRQLPSAQVLFNFVGAQAQADEAALISFVGDPRENGRAAENQRSHLLEINAGVRAGCLTTAWTFSRAVHQPATIRAIAQSFMDAVKGLISHCESPNSGGYTPSDFPEVGLTQEELDQLLEGLD